MNLKRFKMLYLPQIQTTCFLIFTVTTLGYWNYLKNCEEYSQVYLTAESFAGKIYGNLDGVLDDSERLEWHNDMQVKKGKKPSINNLKNFIFSKTSLDGKVAN